MDCPCSPMTPRADIPTLLRQLRGRNRAAQMAAMKVLEAIMSQPDGWQSVADAGSIPILVQLLSIPGNCSFLARRAAEGCWAGVPIRTSAGSDAIAAAGGIKALLQLLGTKGNGVQAQAPRAVSIMGGFPASCAATAEAGGIPPLVQILSSAIEMQEYTTLMLGISPVTKAGPSHKSGPGAGF